MESDRRGSNDSRSSIRRKSSLIIECASEEIRPVAIVPPTSVVRQSLERRLSNRSLNIIASLKTIQQTQSDVSVTNESSSNPNKPPQGRGLIPLTRVVLPAKCQPLVDVDSDNEFEEVFLPSISRKPVAGCSEINNARLLNKKPLHLKDCFEVDLVSSSESEADEADILTGRLGSASSCSSKGSNQDCPNNSKGNNSRKKKKRLKRHSDADVSEAGDDLHLIPPHSIVSGPSSKLKNCLDAVLSGLCLDAYLDTRCNSCSIQ